MYERYKRRDDPGDNATLRFASYYEDIPLEDFTLLVDEFELMPSIRAEIETRGGCIEEMRNATPTISRYAYSGKVRAPKPSLDPAPTGIGKRERKRFAIDADDLEKTQRELQAVPKSAVDHDPDLLAIWKLARAGKLSISQ